jgi:hypothetical protein
MFFKARVPSPSYLVLVESENLCPQRVNDGQIRTYDIIISQEYINTEGLYLVFTQDDPRQQIHPDKKNVAKANLSFSDAPMSAHD